MRTLFELAKERTVNKAIADAANLNDFPLSHLVQVLPDFFPQEFDTIIADVKRTLGNAAYRGTIYVEMGSGGDVVTTPTKPIGEPYPPYRVNIESRNGREVHARRAQRMGSTTHAIIARFPEDDTSHA